MPDTISSGGTLWTYGYNNRRLPISETLNYGGVNYRIGRSYDANGSLSQLTYPDNFSVAYNPNALGEPRQAGGYATGVYFHPNGAIKQFSYGNGILHTLTQYQRGLPQVSQDGNVLKDSYAYDNNDNVTSIADQIEGVTTRSMEYDMLDRLKRVNAPALWGDAWYNYDALDNLTYSQVTGGAKARTLTHNINYATNRLDSVTGSYSLGYQYDSQGNIIQRGGQGYSFDIGNRMRSAPGVTTHAYDGLGRRVSVVGTDGLSRIYVYGQEGKLLYATTTGQALAAGTKYIYLHKHVVAEVDSGGVVYDHTDGLGSPVAKTNAGAGLISRTRYEPYGATAAGTEPTIGFTGHLNAANLGLVDMQQRFYDPVAGRFLSIDPVVTDVKSGGSFNRYGYAANNPFKYVDPDGRQINSTWDLFQNERERRNNADECGPICLSTSLAASSEANDNGASTTAEGLKNDSSNEHNYSWTVFRCLGDCSSKTMGELLRNPAPSAMYSSPVTTGAISTVSIGGYTLGKIMTAVDENTKTIWNLTLPGHLLYPGWVRRDVVFDGGATWVVNTGGGDGFNPLNLNTLLAPIVWGGTSPARGH